MHTQTENENSVLHLCNDDAITERTHHNKKRALTDEVRHKHKLIEENRATLKLHIERTKHLTALHTLPQITN